MRKVWAKTAPKILTSEIKAQQYQEFHEHYETDPEFLGRSSQCTTKESLPEKSNVE